MELEKQSTTWLRIMFYDTRPLNEEVARILASRCVFRSEEDFYIAEFSTRHDLRKQCMVEGCDSRRVNRYILAVGGRHKGYNSCPTHRDGVVEYVTPKWREDGIEGGLFIPKAGMARVTRMFRKLDTTWSVHQYNVDTATLARLNSQLKLIQ